MTSGKTETPTYTKEQIMEMLYQYLLPVSDAISTAHAAYRSELVKVAKRLQKADISIAEFTAYVVAKEQPLHTPT